MPPVFFEFSRIGTIVRVSAIDEETGTEVVLQGPASTSQAELQRLALNKLQYVMAKNGEKRGT